MDIRDFDSNKDPTVVFADNSGGTGKAVRFVYSVPTQFEIHNAKGENLHIKMDDIKHIRKALKYIEMFWGEDKPLKGK
mgnify:CR=1 FL=1|tara:strand:- start:624 stop:857 length:234 start_codon:yes stop_codon:yes gene_type:complete